MIIALASAFALINTYPRYAWYGIIRKAITASSIPEINLRAFSVRSQYFFAESCSDKLFYVCEDYEKGLISASGVAQFPD
jgi:hypothetical protein